MWPLLRGGPIGDSHACRWGARACKKSCSPPVAPEHIVRATLRATYRKVNEQDLAMQVVMTAGRTTSAQTPGRVARLLSQRGFDEDTIETVMGRCCGRNDSPHYL